MKVLTAAEMRDVDRLTIERGIPSLILMESAAHGVLDALRRLCSPLGQHHVTVVCGKGNNGGDGFAIARLLYVQKLCRRLDVFELFDPGDLRGDAAASRRALQACGFSLKSGLPDTASAATVLIDAVLGTGLKGPASGESLEAISVMNSRFPLATKIAVDIPSGLPSELPTETWNGQFFHTDHTVTFTAPKQAQVLSPGYERMGSLTIVPIGSPADLVQNNPSFCLHLTERTDLAPLFVPRPVNSNKGMYGHVMVVGGSFGKSGAPAMAGLGAYRAGAGLVTVAVPRSTVPMVAAYRPELMTEPLPETEGALGADQFDEIARKLQKMSVLALGPGLGTAPATAALVQRLYTETKIPAVIDADALNAMAGGLPKTNAIRVLTPHPGEMGRLINQPTAVVQADRLGAARNLAQESGATVVLKGDRTLIAFPDGQTWVNPTGSPSMATGGTGDILMGMIAGLLAQHGDRWHLAVIAAVWLHGRCGELAAAQLGEQATLATDLFSFLSEAMDEVRPTIRNAL